MPTWDEVKSGLGKAKDTVVEKTGNLTSLASAYIKLKENEAQSDEEYESLGHAAYDRYSRENTDEEISGFENEVAAAIKRIDCLSTQHQVIEKEIENLKKK